MIRILCGIDTPIEAIKAKLKEKFGDVEFTMVTADGEFMENKPTNYKGENK